MSQNYDIVTIGSMFVEIMRKELEKPLSMPADFTGPYPSGDIAIFLNAAAKLGSKCAIIGAVATNLTIGVWFWYGSADVIMPLILPAVLPFNLIKTVLNSALTLLVYKAVSNLITPKKDQVKGR